MNKMKLILFFSFTIFSFSIFAQGAFKVYDKSENTYGVFSIKGEEIVAVDFDKITYINQSFHCVKNNMEGIIAMDGTLVVPVEYDSLLYSNCSQPKLYTAYKDQQWMVYGAKGEVLAELNYDRVSAPLKNTVALFKEDKFYELDLENGKKKEISEDEFHTYSLHYSQCFDLEIKEGFQSAQLTSQAGLVGLKKEDQWVIKPEYRRLNYTGDFWIGLKSDKYGIISAEGKELSKFEFDKISFVNKCAIVEKNGLHGVFSVEEERMIVPMKYDQITFFE